MKVSFYFVPLPAVFTYLLLPLPTYRAFFFVLQPPANV